MSATIGKQINNIFEQVYNLFEESIIPKYLNIENQIIQNTIYDFMNSVKIESEWDMTDEDREGLNKVYFESGYHDSDAVYYPFEDTNDIGIFKFNTLSSDWELALECIIDECDDEEDVNTAKDLLNQLKEITRRIISY